MGALVVKHDGGAWRRVSMETMTLDARGHGDTIQIL